jgi:hypothetical protein
MDPDLRFDKSTWPAFKAMCLFAKCGRLPSLYTPQPDALCGCLGRRLELGIALRQQGYGIWRITMNAPNGSTLGR